MEDITTDVIDKAAMAASGALMLLGIVVLGIVEILAGEPYGAAPLTNDAGEVIAQPAIDPTIRTGLVLAGLAILGLYALYKFATPVEEEEATAVAHRTAD